MSFKRYYKRLTNTDKKGLLDRGEKAYHGKKERLMEEYSDNKSGQTVLKQVFDIYENESVDDELIQRIIAPVKQMILSDRFDNSKRFTVTRNKNKVKIKS